MENIDVKKYWDYGNDLGSRKFLRVATAFSFDSIRDILNNIQTMTVERHIVNIHCWCDFPVYLREKRKKFYFNDATGEVEIFPTFYCPGFDEVKYRVSMFTFSENCNEDGKPYYFRENGQLLVDYMKPGDENDPWDEIGSPSKNPEIAIPQRELYIPRRAGLELITAG